MTRQFIQSALISGMIILLLVQAAPSQTTLTIKVKGGDPAKAVKGAQVHIENDEVHPQFRQDRRTKKNGCITIHSVPPGKYRVQITANGWETFGNLYAVNQSQQEIEINLTRQRITTK